MSNIDQNESISKNFSKTSRFFCVLGGIFAVIGGLSLALLTAAGENSLPQAIANGIGWYCIGKGVFMIASTYQFKGAVNFLRH